MLGIFKNACEVDGPDFTYVAAFTGFNPGVSATTDIITLQGSATSVVRIIQIILSATAATAGAHFDLQVQTRSTAPVGGTFTTVTGVSQDSFDPAPTAGALTLFTAAPTAGTLIGLQGSQKLYAPVPGSALNQPAQFNFGYGAGAKALKLNGTSQWLALSLNGATPANATSFDGIIVWTERPGIPN